MTNRSCNKSSTSAGSHCRDNMKRFNSSRISTRSCLIPLVLPERHALGRPVRRLSVQRMTSGHLMVESARQAREEGIRTLSPGARGPLARCVRHVHARRPRSRHPHRRTIQRPSALTICPSRFLTACPRQPQDCSACQNPHPSPVQMRDLAGRSVLRADAGVRGVLVHALRLAGRIGRAGMLMTPASAPAHGLGSLRALVSEGYG